MEWVPEREDLFEIAATGSPVLHNRNFWLLMRKRTKSKDAWAAAVAPEGRGRAQGFSCVSPLGRWPLILLLWDMK